MRRETLRAVLDQYSCPNLNGKTQVVTARENGRAFYVPLEAALKAASNALFAEDMRSLKFQILVEKMRERGLGDMYEALMGEELPRV